METAQAKPSRIKKILRRLLFALAAVVTLAVLALAEENWRGARAWQNYKREMEAQGDQFDAARLIPPTVPDNENFGMTPLFAPIFSLPADDPRQPFETVTNIRNGQSFVSIVTANLATNIDIDRYNVGNHPDHPPGFGLGMPEDLAGWVSAMQHPENPGKAPIIKMNPPEAASIILDKLKASEPFLSQLKSDAATRPYCRFNIPYDQWTLGGGFPCLMEHLDLIKSLTRFLILHAEAEMTLGHSDEALNDLKIFFRLDDGIKDEPIVISQLVRMSTVALALGAIGEGLAEHRWSEAQLHVLQDHLQNTDLIASTQRGLYGERDIYNSMTINRGFIMYPRGWNRLEQVNVNRGFHDAIFPRIDLKTREISPKVNREIDSVWKGRLTGLGREILHHDVIATMMVSSYFSGPQKLAYAQSEVDMAMLACALERYCLVQGQYPDNLNALVPRFVAVLPHDIINGQPLKYRRTTNGRYMIYSIGWNEKDDSGVVAMRSDNHKSQDVQQGDWVWQYP
jgi:hypothetical protein